MKSKYYVKPVSLGTEQYFGVKKPRIPYELPYLGTLKTKATDEIESSNWMLGCETLDRDYADYHQYKEYICPLGIKILRFQGGWAKTEKEQGVYDWKWMDDIVDDACSRGLKPWIQTGYGNPIYPGAGGENLGAGMPLSETGIAAYERWVVKMVTRYEDKVYDWEVWNEPNFGDNKVNTPEITADFNLRTAKLIKSIQPEARISALALGHIDVEYVERFFKYLSDRDGCGLFHDVTYHDYCYNPDANKLNVYKVRQIVEKYAPGLVMRQGENGAPSVRGAGGALANHDWTEFSQAKWDTRRMLENLGNDIECNVFCIAEMQYTGNGPITTKNTKGLLETNPDNTVVRPKVAYYAVQHVTSIFDDTMERIKGAIYSHNIDGEENDEYWISTDESIAVYGYQKKGTNKRLYSIWQEDAVPGNDSNLVYRDLVFRNSRFEHPVFVDIVTGNVYDIPKAQWEKDGKMDRFTNIPLFDSPIVITDISLITIE